VTLAVDAAAPGSEGLAEALVEFLETNTPPPGLFAPNVFCDLSLPRWRIQSDTVEALVQIRHESHPDLGKVTHWRVDPTPDGLLFEFEERWTDASGESWYAREMIRATVANGQLTELSIYCTGDWDSARVAEHAAAVRLLRP
jgi:hypothetical protein